MMRGLFIAACVLSLIYVLAAFGLAARVEEARDAAFYEMMDTFAADDYYSDDPYGSGYDISSGDVYEDIADSATQMAGIISVIYMIISAVVFVLALMKVKTATIKVLAIIGLSLSGIFMIWGFMPMVSPGAVSFDEVGPAFGMAGVVLLAFNIVGTIHAFRTSQ